LARMRIPRTGPIIGIVPASRRETRRWPASSFAEVGRGLRDRHGANVIVFWGPGEEDLANEVRDGIGEAAFLSPMTPGVRELTALLGRCHLVVTNCNGPRHLATARGVATVTIHGSSDPASWNPLGLDRHPFVRLEDLHCIGCRKNVCPYGLECMKDLSASKVLETAERVLTGLQEARS